jgi:hypothetical protein
MAESAQMESEDVASDRVLRIGVTAINARKTSIDDLTILAPAKSSMGEILS